MLRQCIVFTEMFIVLTEMCAVSTECNYVIESHLTGDRDKSLMCGDVGLPGLCNEERGYGWLHSDLVPEAASGHA